MVQTKRFLCSFLEKLWILCANCWQNSTSNHSILCAPIFKSVVNTFAVSKSSPYHTAPQTQFLSDILMVCESARAHSYFSLSFHTPQKYFSSSLFFFLDRRFSHLFALFFCALLGISDEFLLISMSHSNYRKLKISCVLKTWFKS